MNAGQVLAGRARRSGPPGGFTRLEMLVVITMLMIMAGLLLGSLSYARRRAAENRTRLRLELLCHKIEEYYNDHQEYPLSAGPLPEDGIRGSERLLTALRSEEKGGPYIMMKDIDTCDENGNGKKEVADVWGRAYRYYHYRDYGGEKPNRNTFRLYSLGYGGNLEQDVYSPFSDAIVNWNKQKPNAD